MILKEKVKHKLIDEACDSFKNISDNIVNEKFKYIDKWIYKISNRFKLENKQNLSFLFPRFSYGTILKVDFGINEGTELTGPHFAIVLNKYDSIKHGTVTVLPLTSQNKSLNLPLNELIIDKFTKRVSKGISDLIHDIKVVKDKQNYDEVEKKSNELHDLQVMFDYYSNYAKNSYACMD